MSQIQTPTGLLRLVTLDELHQLVNKLANVIILVHRNVCKIPFVSTKLHNTITVRQI